MILSARSLEKKVVGAKQKNKTVVKPIGISRPNLRRNCTGLYGRFPVNEETVGKRDDWRVPSSSPYCLRHNSGDVSEVGQTPFQIATHHRVQLVPVMCVLLIGFAAENTSRSNNHNQPDMATIFVNTLGPRVN